MTSAIPTIFPGFVGHDRFLRMQSGKLKRRSRQPSQSTSHRLSSSFRQLIEKDARKLFDSIEFKTFEETGCKEEQSLKIVDLESHRSSPITLENFFREKTVITGSLSNACNHTCVTGSKGAGKTTLLCNFIEKAHKGEISSINPEDLVHWINWKAYNANERLTVAQFLFGSVVDDEATQADVTNAFEWALRNPTKLVFVLDNLESLLTDSRWVSIGAYDMSSPKNIILNVLEGTLFVGCSVLSTCDEAMYEYLTEGDDKVGVSERVCLCGLTNKSVNRIALKFLGESCYRESFVHLKNSSPYVMALCCENPTILALTLIGLRGEQEMQYLPKAMCGIGVKFLLEMTKSRSHVCPILNKLKKAAYLAKKRSSLYLTRVRLKAVGLLDDEIREVLTFKTFRLLYEEEDGLFKFANPVMQNIFFSLYVAESDWDEFQSILSSLHDDQDNSCIVRYMFGFVLDDEVFKKTMELFEPGSSSVTRITNDRGKKSNKLKAFAVNAISSIEYAFEASEQFNTLHMIAECGSEAKGLLFNNFTYFTLERYGCLMLNNTDMCALAICICFSVNFESLNMSNCYLPASMLEFLHETMIRINSSMKFKSFHFDLSGKNVGRRPSSDDAVALSRFLIHVSEYFFLNGWLIDKFTEESFQEKLDDLQAFKLKVFINENDVLTAQSRWCDIVQEVIAQDGGSIHLNDCGLDFSEGSLAQKSKVVVEMKNCERTYPDEYLMISPSIHVCVGTDLLKAVLVSMRAWCVLDDDSCNAVAAEGVVLHLDDDGENWKPVIPIDVTETSKVQFECKSFSTIAIALKAFLAPMFTFPLTAIICSKGTTWGIAFCLDHKSTAKETDEVLKMNGFSKLCPPVNPIHARVGDTAEIELKISEPPGFYLDIDGDNLTKFKLTKKFLRHPRFRLNTFLLKKKTRRGGKCTVVAKYETFLNHVREEDGGGVFQCEVEGVEGVKPVERLEDAFQEIIHRFANGAEFRKFAISTRGFGLDMNVLSGIEEDKPKVFDQQLEMLRMWKMKQGDRATPQKLRSIVATYFDDVPDADKAQQLQLDEEFDNALREFKTYHDWINFARYGLGLTQESIDRIIGEQENITKDQKMKMLTKWKEENKASVTKFRQAVDNFINPDS